EVVVVRHRGGVHEGDAGAAALHRVAGHRQRAKGHAVEGAGEGDDRLAAGDLPGQLERRLDGVGTPGPGEPHLVVEAAGPEDLLGERGQEITARSGEHVERVDDLVVREVLKQRLLQLRVVVAVVERAGAGEEVEVLGTVLRVQGGSDGAVEDD